MCSWGGAQWVLATLFVVVTLLPLGGRAAGYNNRTDWGMWYATEIASRAGLILILYWGGFWS